jgi:hypothetical protein
MILKEELQHNVSLFHNERLELIEKRIKGASKYGYSDAEFSPRFYDDSVIEHFKNEGLIVELRYTYLDPDKLKSFILKW